MRKLVIIGLIFTFVVAGSGATVYAAQGSLPTAPLYPLKLAGEELQITLARDPEVRLDLLLGYIASRTREITRLVEQDSPVPEQTVVRLEAQLRACLRLAAEQSEVFMPGDLLRIRDRLATQTRLMDEAQVHAPNDTTLAWGLGVMRQTQAMVEDGLREPQRFREQLQAGNGVASNPTAVAPGQGPGPGPEFRPTDAPARPETESQGPGPGPEFRPTDAPARPETESQGPGPGPEFRPTETPAEPEAERQGPGPGPEFQPGGTPADVEEQSDGNYQPRHTPAPNNGEPHSTRAVSENTEPAHENGEADDH